MVVAGQVLESDVERLEELIAEQEAIFLARQPRAVGILEIIDVAAVGAGLRSWLQLFDQPLDHPPAARAR